MISPPRRHPIFDAISKSAEDDVDAVRKYIDMKASEGGVDSIDLQDDSGMTLLMHAAWKGKLKVRFCFKLKQLKT